MDYKEYNSSTKIPTTRMPQDMPLASSYVPYQFWEEPMPPQEALKEGTIFHELNLPFMCYGGADYER